MPGGGDETALWQFSNARHAELLGTADVREGIEAFFARRRPDWQGR